MLDQLFPDSQNLEHVTRQHAEWQQEHKAWKEDIASWQREYDQVIVLLHKIERLIPDHGTAIHEHLEHIDRHELQLKAHGKALVVFQAESIEGPLNKFLAEHQDAEKRHMRTREQHKRFREIHSEAVIEMHKLAAELMPKNNYN